MKHDIMTKKERSKAEDSFNSSTSYKIDLFTEEPYIMTEDGTKYYIEEVV